MGSLGPAFSRLWLLVTFWSHHGQVAFVEFCASPSPKKSQLLVLEKAVSSIRGSWGPLATTLPPNSP